MSDCEHNNNNNLTTKYKHFPSNGITLIIHYSIMISKKHYLLFEIQSNIHNFLRSVTHASKLLSTVL